jgi:hypothetical protein
MWQVVVVVVVVVYILGLGLGKDFKLHVNFFYKDQLDF